MFTWIETQTEPCAGQLFTKENRAFWPLMQKALLLSLYEEKLISAEDCQQCLCQLKNGVESFD